MAVNYDDGYKKVAQTEERTYGAVYTHLEQGEDVKKVILINHQKPARQ